MGAAWLLPRTIGLGRASQLLFTGEFVKAERAEHIGLVNRVLANDELEKETRTFAAQISRGPGFAHSMTKKMLEYEAHVDFSTGIEAEAQAQAICMQHPDFREAYDSWVAKREAKFQ